MSNIQDYDTFIILEILAVSFFFIGDIAKYLYQNL